MQTLLQYRQEKRYASLVHARSNSLKSPLPPFAHDDSHNSDSELEVTGREHSSAQLVDLEQQRPLPSPISDSYDEKSSPDGNKDKITVQCDDDGKDQADPHNWSRSKRLWTTLLLFLMVFSQGWVSACDSNVTKPSSREFHVSQTSETLATALFILGISLGSLVVGPLSEELGRSPVYLVPSFLYLCFTLGDALAPNFAAQLVFRFLAGICSSSTLSIYGGSLADMWDNEERNNVWPVFALSPLLSPILSPVAGGWISGHISWRWVYWIGLILLSHDHTVEDTPLQKSHRFRQVHLRTGRKGIARQEACSQLIATCQILYHRAHHHLSGFLPCRHLRRNLHLPQRIRIHLHRHLGFV
jgi:DHA1 family multidrug resistance protein-like MFS transporter